MNIDGLVESCLTNRREEVVETKACQNVMANGKETSRAYDSDSSSDLCLRFVCTELVRRLLALIGACMVCYIGSINGSDINIKPMCIQLFL